MRTPGVEAPGVRTQPRVAIAHDYLTQRGGAERVVLTMLKAFPGATVYTTLYNPERTFPEFKNERVVASPLNRLRFFREHHRVALPFLAPVSSRFEVDADLILVSSSGWAHGFAGDAPRLVFCHNPARWLYQTRHYLGQPAYKSMIGLATVAMRGRLRRWDKAAAARADRYLANSRVVRERIRRAYGIDAALLHPPHSVDVTAWRRPVPELEEWADERGFDLLVSRLLPYKNVDKAIEGYRGSAERLVIVGHGPSYDQLAASLPSNVRMISGIEDDQLRWLYAECTLLIAPSMEDYGLTPLEAAAFGKPTIALRAGGYLDTIDEGVSGAYFDLLSPTEIAATLRLAHARDWDREAILAHAEKFSEGPFIAALQREVAELWERTQAAKGT